LQLLYPLLWDCFAACITAAGSSFLQRLAFDEGGTLAWGLQASAAVSGHAMLLPGGPPEVPIGTSVG
jgi:hypothetical protein